MPETNNNENEDVLDSLLEKLRRGDAIGRQTRRTRRRPPVLPSFDVDGMTTEGVGEETAKLARGMLAQLQSDGFFVPTVPSSPTTSKAGSGRHRRRRGEGMSSGTDKEMLETIVSEEIMEVEEDGEADI